MAIPRVFAPITRQDFKMVPVTVHKKFELSSVNLTTTSSGYNIVDAEHANFPTPIGSNKAINDPTNSFDGSFRRDIWQHIEHLYYRHAYDPHATFEHANRRYTYKFLNYSASLFSIPYFDFGESINPRSVIVSNSTDAYTLQDDGNGNLYDPSITTSSFTNSYNLVGYWGFNDQFSRFRFKQGSVSKGEYRYESRVFEPDEPSGIKNITFDRGVANHGMQAEFNGDGYILTHNRDEFNSDNTETFSIGFWVQASVSQSNETTQYNSLVSKRGVIRKNVAGVNKKFNKSDIPLHTYHISSSIEDLTTDIYPYDIEFINSSAGVDAAGKIRVRRSDGITISEITSSATITDDKQHYISLLLGTSSMMLYVDDVLEGSASILVASDIYNDHSIMFGALNRNLDQAFSGSMDEIRFSDTEWTTAQMTTLYDSASMAMFQTAVVGNVFYRQGNIIVSPLNLDYINAFKNTWNISFESTHTIFEYEVLCRVKKGSFNMTYNPTARKSFKSDLLTDNMTGSLLLPYMTTIGLYNDKGEMVAVAKLGQAVQMRSDVDLNFLVRWDA